IGLDKLMWGSDYPHMEGTWPNTMDKLRESFSDVPEDEIRALLGLTAAGVFSFDMNILMPVAERVGPFVSDITGAT
ncbi:MAG: amidohydrolase family protein, partial [Halioglobus sp.]